MTNPKRFDEIVQLSKSIDEAVERISAMFDPSGVERKQLEEILKDIFIDLFVSKIGDKL